MSTFLVDIEDDYHVLNFFLMFALVRSASPTRSRSATVFAARRCRSCRGKARQFCHDAVRDVNPDTDKATQSLLLEVSGVDKKDAKGTTAVLMELTTVHGMVEIGPGVWTCSTPHCLCQATGTQE